MNNTYKLGFLFFFFILFTINPVAIGQVTVTLGSGTYAFSTSPTGPSPYNTEYAGRVMQFIYTASEIKAAGGSEGEILSMAWKVKDVAKVDINDYGIWMKNTKAKDASSHDGNNLKQVMNRFTYKTGSAGWQTLTLDSAFYWDGTSNILIHVCFGALASPTPSGSVYAYSNISNQRRGEISKGSGCGMTTSSSYNYKPFIQFVIDPYCISPNSVQFSGVTSSGATANWSVAASGAEGYEYLFSNAPGTPTQPGTYTTDTTASISGLCPGKVYYFYVRSVCGKEDTSEWSKTYAFSTPNAGKITSNAPVCVGDSLNMMVEDAIDYTWSGPAGFKSTVKNPFIKAAQKGNSGNYVVTITDSNACKVTYAATLRVDTLPTIIFTQNGPVCSGNDLMISANGGNKYSWTGPNGFTADTNTFTITSTSTKNTGSYVVKVENSFGCSSTSQVAAVVNLTPTFTASSNTPICSGDSLKMTATGKYSFIWAGPQSYVSTDTNPVRTNVSTSFSGSYTVTATSDKNCSAQSTINVVISALPKVEISGNGDVCEMMNLSLSGSGAETYEWFKGMNKVGGSQNYTLNGINNSNAGTYRVVGTDKNNCKNWAEKEVSVLTLPTIDFTVPDSVCEGQALNLIGQTNSSNYGWTGPGGLNSKKLTEKIENIELNQKGTYKFKSTASNGCGLELDKYVNVLPKPNVTISKQGNNLLASSGFSTYTWYKNGVEITGISGRLLTVDSIGKYAVKVVGTNGCEAESDEVNMTSLGFENIDLSASINIYPNPTSSILNIQSDREIKHLIIYNSLGSVVAEFDVRQNNASIDVKMLPAGVFIVMAQTEGGSTVRKSFLKAQ